MTTIETISTIYNACLDIMLDVSASSTVERRAYTVVLACRRAYGLEAAEQSAIIGAALEQIAAEVKMERAIISETTSRSTVRRAFDSVAEATEWARSASFGADTAVRLWTKRATFDAVAHVSYVDEVKTLDRASMMFV